MDPKHEEFFRQFEWIDSNKIKGMHKPRKIKDEPSIIFSKKLVYRGFGFRLRLYDGGSSGLIYGRMPKGMFGFSCRAWEKVNRWISKERIWYFKNKKATRRERVERHLLHQLEYIDWILDSENEEFERVGRMIVKDLEKTQREARVWVVKR